LHVEKVVVTVTTVTYKVAPMRSGMLPLLALQLGLGLKMMSPSLVYGDIFAEKFHRICVVFKQSINQSRYFWSGLSVLMEIDT